MKARGELGNEWWAEHVSCFPRYCDLTSNLATKGALVTEYAATVTARKHTFTSETNRLRYAELIHALGAYTYGRGFIEEATIKVEERRNLIRSCDEANEANVPSRWNSKQWEEFENGRRWRYIKRGAGDAM